MDAFNVLFICEHNTGRSQIVEAYLEKVREIRNQIKSKVMEFIQDVKRKGLKIFIEDTEQ